MNTKSHKELQIQIENLFLSLSHIEDFQVKKSELLKAWGKINFIYKKGAKLNFSTSPTLNFKSVDALKDFLQKEKELAISFQEFENSALISKLLKDSTETTSIDFFKMDYEIEYSDNEINVLFYTNSLVFKYEIIGARQNNNWLKSC